MQSIRNVPMGDCDIDSMCLGTSGVSSCIAVLVETKDKIFIYHAGSDSFNSSLECSINDTYTFLIKIYDNVYRLIPNPIVEYIYLVGGWNNQKYSTLKNQINRIRDRCNMTMEQDKSLTSNTFMSFISKITLNLICFNVPTKTSDGNEKDENDDDRSDDYIFDFTIIYDRHAIHKLTIFQFGGPDKEMNANRSENLLYVVYVFDTKLKNLQACICSNGINSPHSVDIRDQALLNVNNPTCVKDSFNSDDLEQAFKNLLSRIEKA